MSRRVYLCLATGAVALVALVAIATLKLALAPSRAPGDSASSVSAPQPALRPDAMREAVGVMVDAERAFVDRIAAIRSVGRALAADEVALVRGAARRSGENETVRNDLWTLLESQPQPPDDLGADLLAIWNDSAESATIRDYAIQHMAHVYGFDRDPKALEDALIAASKLTEGTFPGTAMLSLSRIQDRSDAAATALREVAARTVLDETADKNATVTALQIARAGGDASVLERSRQLAADEKEPVRVRMSSIGYLGERGSVAVDLPLLEKLTTDKEERISRVARYNAALLKKKKSE